MAQARRRIEELEAELALLRNGHSNAHPEVTNGEGEPPAAPSADSYETVDSGESHETYGAIGHSRVTNGPTERPTGPAFHSYENPVSDGSQGSPEAIGHFGVTNGLDEGQEYLSRRARVEDLVMEHRGYYDRSFTGGVLSAIHYFAESPDREMELLRQVDLRRRAQEPDDSGAGPSEGIEGRSPPTNPETGRREVEYCPECGSPYTTFNERNGARTAPTAGGGRLRLDERPEGQPGTYPQVHPATRAYFEALGFQRPGGLPRYYTEQRPEEWPLDLAKVERLKREEQTRDRAASRSDRTASSGMSEEARHLLDSIRDLAGQGLTPGQIAAQLTLIEDGVRNVLAMGRHAYNPEAEAPAHTPEIKAYRNGFARRSW